MTLAEKQSNLNLPGVILGTSALGNLFVALDGNVKREIIKEYIDHSTDNIVFDSAGKYGAGLALESLGKYLRELRIAPENVTISNKLGWFRTKLKTPEPMFEKGVWVGLKHDAVQMISYKGMMTCFEQGNELLNGYQPEMLSVHDPDEYLQAAKSIKDEQKRYEEILEAYQALADLKANGKIKSVGIGAKDWKTIIRIAKDVKLDWVMIANSMTIKSHPSELLAFMTSLQKENIPVINSAVFHAGFLIGGNFYDYKLANEDLPGYEILIKWRSDFFETCKDHDVKPAEACVRFALNAPGVRSVALSTTNPKRIKENLEMSRTVIPDQFWMDLVEKGLVNSSVPFLNSIMRKN